MVWKLFSTKITEYDLDQYDHQIRGYIGATQLAVDREIDTLQRRLTDLSERDQRADNDRLRDCESIKELIEHMGKVAIERTAQIQALSAKVSELEKKGAPAQLPALVGRIEALEGRIASLHGMLVDENPVSGKKKLSSLGKRVKAFYGN